MLKRGRGGTIMRKNKSVNMANILFAVVGGLFFAIGAYLVISTLTFKINAEEVMALITDMIPYEDSDGDTSYEVEVEYEYEGFTFSAVLDTYSSGMREGEWISILVNKDDPMEIVEPGTNLVIGIVFMALGGIAILVGGISFIKEQKHKKKLDDLRKNGKRLQARIDQITLNENIAINEEHPYIIWCSYVDEFSGARFEYKSENIWNDVYEVCDVGSVIDVLVKPDDYLDYVVDVDSLIDYSIKNNEW